MLVNGFLRRPSAMALTVAMLLVPTMGSAQDATDEVPLATSPDGAWVVATFDAWEQGLAEPLPDSRLTVSLLADGRLEGESACGRFEGGWSIDGEELIMGVAPSGNLGCGELETREAIGLATALGAVASWQPTETGVELLDAAGNVRLRLETVSLGDPSGEWEVQRYRRPNGKLVEPLPEQLMSLTLTIEGSIDGSTGCRSLMGEYSYQGSAIILGPLEISGDPCDGDVRRAERQLLRAFGEVVYWELEGDALTFTDGFDAPVVELLRTLEPPAAAEPEE